jgi:LysR family nitrogen assimilation transcriptional regulator
MIQGRIENKYRFNMQVSSKPMAGGARSYGPEKSSYAADLSGNWRRWLDPTCIHGFVMKASWMVLNTPGVPSLRACETLQAVDEIEAKSRAGHMQFRQLRYFVKIVEAGSFSRAASVVHVAQPALSQQVAELEQRLGVALLQRSARGVRPTAAGDVLYKEASAILHQLDQLPNVVRSSTDEPEGTVKLAFVSSLAPGLVGFLDECREAFPKVVIRVSDGDSLTLERKIASASVDLAILYEDAFTTALMRKPLFRQKLFLVSRQPVADPGNAVSLERVAELPLVLPATTNGRRVLLERVFAEAKLTPNVVLEADSLVSEIWAVRNEVGCTILPVGDLSNFGPNAFAKPTLIEPPIYLTCSIVYSADFPLTNAGEAVRDSLLAFIKRRVSETGMPGAEWIRER